MQEPVECPILALHYSSDLWPAPEAFDAQRFATEAPQQEECAFMPFGHGPATCPAQRLAMIALKALLVALLRRYRVRGGGGGDGGDRPPFGVKKGTLLPLPGVVVSLVAA